MMKMTIMIFVMIMKILQMMTIDAALSSEHSGQAGKVKWFWLDLAS